MSVWILPDQANMAIYSGYIYEDLSYLSKPMPQWYFPSYEFTYIVPCLLVRACRSYFLVSLPALMPSFGHLVDSFLRQQSGRGIGGDEEERHRQHHCLLFLFLFLVALALFLCCYGRVKLLLRVVLSYQHEASYRTIDQGWFGQEQRVGVGGGKGSCENKNQHQGWGQCDIVKKNIVVMCRALAIYSRLRRPKQRCDRRCGGGASRCKPCC